MLPDHSAPLYAAPLSDLLVMLLRQFKRLLAEKGVEMDDAAMKVMAQAACDRVYSGDNIPAVRVVLAALITESESVLARWNLTFPQALVTPMDAIPGWESTSDFLEIANEKSNAELRIAAGGTLLAALNDYRCTPSLLAAIDHAPDEVETIIARRVLLFASGVEGDAPDWRARLGEWVEHHHA
jgi:hypothetical protein